ncbi:odorant receptor Or2-like isoform X2 [Bacillus rossius redtenbacheri]|uniref:odorant receptor Or2-like isoform X2 n=1 Tax=Bacillus rossius redtenbacheri TaxID=93214 RepID=UPI002FDDD0A7
MIFVMVVNNLFKMTIVTVDMVLTPVSDVNFGGILQLQMCTLVHVIIYCWGSAQVTWQSEAVLHAGYCCGWPEAGRSFKQALRLLMTRAARPAGFTIGGYGPLTLQTFLGMINFAYSVYAVLRQKYN